MERQIAAMLECMARGNPVYLPSKFWERYNAKNQQELDSQGFENLKRTVATNYFTWVVDRTHEQFRFLRRHTRLRDWPAILWGAGRADPGVALPPARQRQLAVLVRMLWKFAERRDPDRLLARLAEPEVGNPFPIRLGARLISQDLANAVLEYGAIREHFRPGAGERPVICELGAGYGRNAYVFAHAVPQAKYVIVDIPPALHVAERYLSEVLPGRRVFGFRCFEDFESVREEFESADLAFLLPHQAELLPAKSVDLFVNISSLHEMTMEQIGAYFGLVDRTTRGFFYTKQWYVSENPDDGIRVRHTDYPVPGRWRQLFHRPAPVQRSFFEAMYALPREAPVASSATPAASVQAVAL